MQKMKIVLCWVDAVISLITKFLLGKEELNAVGAIYIAKDEAGKNLGEVLGIERKLRIKTSEDTDPYFRKSTLTSLSIQLHPSSRIHTHKSLQLVRYTF